MSVIDSPETFSLPDTDEPADFINPSADVEPLLCAEPGCLNEVIKPARGRTPKYCPEHKAGTHSATGGSTRRAGNRGWAKAGEVEAGLTQLVEWTGLGVGFLNREDGTIIQKGGPDLVHALVELAKDDRELRKYLEWIAAPGKYGPLTMAALAIVIPILANHGLIPTIPIGPTKRKET